jgi:hypothetical protein
MYRELIQPRHKIVTDFARARGVEIFFFDSDGNINGVLPDLLAAGINFFFPIECAAGMDPVALRKKYGKSIRMVGGIDKMEIARDKQAIRNELQRKIPALIKEGGYLPQIDHGVGTDISLENYTYFIATLKDLCDIQR